MKAQRGQTLIEILLAVTVSIIVLSAIVVGIVNSLNNTQYTKNQNLANSYAQEGMSVVKAIKDSDWNTFSSFTTANIYCIDQNSAELTPDPCGSNVGIFSRQVEFEHDSQECCSNDDPSCVTGVKGTRAVVEVSWADSKCPVGNIRCHNVKLVTCLSNIDKKSID